MLVGVGVDPQSGWIHEGTPDPFAATAPDLQAVGVMDLRPPVIVDPAIVFADEKHTRARSDPETLDLLAGIKSRIDIHGERLGGADHKAIGPGDAGRVEQPVYRESTRVLGGLLQIVRHEIGKLLRRRGAAIYRQASL